MTMNVNPINDAESARQKRNLTDSQKKIADATKEGLVVNTFVKNPNMDDVYDSMLISANTKMPSKLNEYDNSKEKSILPLALISTGVMGAITLASLFVRRNAKINLKIKTEQKLTSMPRNVSINEETHQAMYQMVQCPNQKTIMAGVGVLTVTAMAFMGKMFVDGFKDVWVKKREADIQKNLQEKLIAVETQSFSGKIQIVRSMLSNKAKEFGDYICPKTEATTTCCVPFGKNAITEEKTQKSNWKYFALGALTLGSIIGLGFASLKNLTASKKYLEKYIIDSKNQISDIIKNSNQKSKEFDKINLKNMMQSIDADPKFIRTELSKLNWNQPEKDSFIEEVSFDIEKSLATADKALGGDGPPKPTFYSHVNDYRAFLYNYLLDTKNPQFKQLFFGITGLSAISYSGKAFGEGVKDIQVKKMNAQTELELQQRLVSTELRNFKAKKDAAINPLSEEFYNQVKKGKPANELKTMAENILFEVKNGPPFVYS